MSLQRDVNLRAQWLRRWGNVPVLKYAVSVHCTAGMYAHRERRQHMTQEDFEFAVAKVRHISFSLSKFFCADYILQVLIFTGIERKTKTGIPQSTSRFHRPAFVPFVLIIIHFSMLYGL